MWQGWEGYSVGLEARPPSLQGVIVGLEPLNYRAVL